MNLISSWSHKTIYFHLHLLSTAENRADLYHHFNFREHTHLEVETEMKKQETSEEKEKKNCYSLQLFGVFILLLPVIYGFEPAMVRVENFSRVRFSVRCR